MNNTITQLIEDPLRQVEQCYAEALRSDVPLMQTIVDYCGQKRGKMLRPMLTLLSAGVEKTLHSRSTVLLATAMEMLHNASLFHDDVVDEDTTRRGQPSANSRWGNKAAVLCGDYHLAKAMQLIKDSGRDDAYTLVSQTVVSMSEGELMQLSLDKNSTRSTDTYLRIIGCKTASLMSTCCAIACPSMKEFGYNYGMAFQIKDDMTDGEAFPAGVEPSALLEKYKAAALQSLQALPASKYRDALKEMIRALS